MSVLKKYKIKNHTTLKRVEKQVQDKMYESGLTIARNLSFVSLEPRFIKKYGEAALKVLIKNTPTAYVN